MLEYRNKSEENSGNTGNAAYGGQIVFAAPVIRIGGGASRLVKFVEKAPNRSVYKL